MTTSIPCRPFSRYDEVTWTLIEYSSGAGAAGASVANSRTNSAALFIFSSVNSLSLVRALRCETWLRLVRREEWDDGYDDSARCVRMRQVRAGGPCGGTCSSLPAVDARRLDSIQIGLSFLLRGRRQERDKRLTCA